MEKEANKKYEAPAETIMEVRQEGSICQSGGKGSLGGFRNGGGDAWSGGSNSGGSSMGGWTNNGGDAWE